MSLLLQENGYLKVQAKYEDETTVDLMLTTKSVQTFINCEGKCERQCQDPENQPVQKIFYGSGIAGLLFKRDVRLCLSDWCSTDQDISEMACVQQLSGSLNTTTIENSKFGLWGLSPGGSHPAHLTICIGNKLHAGRVVSYLEPDISPSDWLDFHSNFILNQGFSKAPSSVFFVNPDSFWNADNQLHNFPSLNSNMSDIDLRIDFSSSYSFVPKPWYDEAKRTLVSACKSLNCGGYRDFSDGAALICYRFMKSEDESLFPDLQWILGSKASILVPPSKYFFTTSDGSRCVGLFESSSPQLAVLGLNFVSGLRIRIDYLHSRLKLDACTAKSSLPTSTVGLDALSNEQPEDYSAEVRDWNYFVFFAFIFVGFVLGLLLGACLALKYLPTRVRHRKINLYHKANLIKKKFKSRKQTFRTVKFVEEQDSSSSSDEESAISAQPTAKNEKEDTSEATKETLGVLLPVQISQEIQLLDLYPDKFFTKIRKQ